MIKLITKILVALSIFAASLANAGLITTDLTEDAYITYNNIDWTWASPVNTASWGTNTLYGPELHAGWRYASLTELDVIRSTLTLSAFTKKDEQNNDVYIQSVEYWNDVFISLTEDVNPESSVSITNFIGGYISSDPTYYVNSGLGEVNYFERFYVRDIADRPTAQVPEPSTLMIFAIALIALSLRKRAIQ
jgi:hypothetical protein